MAPLAAELSEYCYSLMCYDEKNLQGGQGIHPIKVELATWPDLDSRPWCPRCEFLKH